MPNFQAIVTMVYKLGCIHWFLSDSLSSQNLVSLRICVLFSRIRPLPPPLKAHSPGHLHRLGPL